MTTLNAAIDEKTLSTLIQLASTLAIPVPVEITGIVHAHDSASILITYASENLQSSLPLPLPAELYEDNDDEPHSKYLEHDSGW